MKGAETEFTQEQIYTELDVITTLFSIYVTELIIIPHAQRLSSTHLWMTLQSIS